MTDPVTLQAKQAMATKASLLPELAGSSDPAHIRKTAREFEAVFLGQMLQPMFANLGAQKPFGGGMAEDMWQSLLADEYGKAIAERGGIGIADSVVREVLRIQEMQMEKRQ
jgi:Rod binding domain-containing protein